MVIVFLIISFGMIYVLKIIYSKVARYSVAVITGSLEGAKSLPLRVIITLALALLHRDKKAHDVPVGQLQYSYQETGVSFIFLLQILVISLTSIKIFISHGLSSTKQTENHIGYRLIGIYLTASNETYKEILNDISKT